MKKQLFISDFDMKRFSWLLNNSEKFDDMYKKHLSELEKELQNAVVVEPKDIPPDVITMHTRFTIMDLTTNQKFEYTLVFPFDADIEQNKLSILAPIGVAVIGCKVGDEITWETPGGKRTIIIEKISYQPEAAGSYYI